MIYYYGNQISPNQLETGEGFLICKNVPVARIGDMEYYGRELGLSEDPDRLITVRRLAEDVFEPAAVASFEGKPVTDGHPSEQYVTPENYSAYAKGHIENLRRQDGYLVGDIHLNDAALISDVANGVKREVSCGYQCEYVPLPDGTFKQIHIRGNHVAVVPKGRAGSMVSIKDEKPTSQTEERSKRMGDYTKKILGIFGRAVKDANPEEAAAMADTAAEAIEAARVRAAVHDAQQMPKEEEAAGEARKEEAADKAIPMEPKGADLGAKIDRLLTLMEALTQKGGLDEEKPAEPSNEEQLDAILKEEGGETEAEKEEAVTVPADDVQRDACKPTADALSIVKALRPVIANIPDDSTKKMVTDALIAAYRSPSSEPMEGVLKAAQDAAKRNAGETKHPGEICRRQKQIYDSFNPHKKGGN